MKSKHKREYTKENYIMNGSKNSSDWASNSIVSTIQEPKLNESGIEAKKNGF